MKNTLLAPRPKKIRTAPGNLRLSPEDRTAVNRYLRGGSLPDCIRLEIGGASGLTGEAYRLEVGEAGIKIEAAAESGVFYAVQTLKQLLGRSGQQPDELSLGCCSISDSPDFPVRMVMLDVSRGRVPTMDSVKDFISRCAEWKYNQFQLYTEHTFAYEKHRTVWQDASPFTAAEIRELSKFCADRYIELVPNQNSFGHMECWFRHEDYHSLAESPEGFTDPFGVFREHSSTLAPAVPDTRGFLAGLYEELLPNFDSEMLNVGGDEPYELGMGRSEELCREKGLDRVYLDFLLELRELAAVHGKKIQIYGDIIMKYPHLIKELPRDIVLVNWGYEADHPFDSECEQIAASGIPFYVCTGVSSWNSIGGRWSNTKRNIVNGAAAALKHGAAGFSVSEWGDNGHWQQQSAGLPGFLFGACAAWNSGALDSFEPEVQAAGFIFGGDRALARAAMKIQDVWECSKHPLHNVSLPAVILLDPVYPYYREDFKRFRDYDFADELELLDEADSLLEQAAASDFKEEVQFSSALLRHGCNLGRLQLATGDLRIGQISAKDRSGLADELRPLIEEFTRLWRKTSRPGGFERSIGGFNVLERLYLT